MLTLAEHKHRLLLACAAMSQCYIKNTPYAAKAYLTSDLLLASSRSVEMNGYTAALRDQYINTSMSTHYQLLPHLFSYAAQSGLLAPQPRSLYPQSHPLVLQLVAAEDLAPLATPMLIEDG